MVTLAAALPLLLSSFSSPGFPSASTVPVDSAAEAAVAARVEIIRTEYGVPHIYAEDLQAMGFGLAWVELEDYGAVTALNLVRARGEYGLYTGRDSVAGDFGAREDYAHAVSTWPLLMPETRAVYEGFAAGVRYYVRLHRSEFPAWLRPVWTGLDAHAREVEGFGAGGGVPGFIRALQRPRAAAPRAPQAPAREATQFERPAYGPTFEPSPLEDGSNAWTFNKSRTKSGKAILLRNPHLAWNAGYYEAHVIVPGVVDFYGDFRIGGTFGTVGGFNRYLGFATTNNAPQTSQIYALEADPQRDNHYLLDGRSHALQERKTTVEYRTPDGGIATSTRSSWWTDYGPVIYQGDGRIYIAKGATAGEYRRGEQFLRMMMSKSLAEWLEVMSMRAHPTSNFSYADAAGNNVLYYNARIPLLPHAPTPDSFFLARSSKDIWTELVPFEDLPIFINPRGGYTSQANDSPDFTNLNVAVDRDTLPPNIEPVNLRPRSQMSLTLIGGTDKLSLEDVVRLKHSPRMLLAERLTDELVSAIKESGTAATGKLAEALRALESWDRTAAADSRGGVLFYAWSNEYRQAIDTARYFREPWTPERPMETPAGLGSPKEAVAAFAKAAAWMDERGWAYDMKWGDAFRVVRGTVDEPVSACTGELGCFRRLAFAQDSSRRFVANSGDGWVLAVEFRNPPRAYSVLAYGQSNQEGHPYYDDQAALFARGEMKTVRFTRADVEKAAVRRYRPGS
jgi:acyl-homoserine-lactone acylase